MGGAASAPTAPPATPKPPLTSTTLLSPPNDLLSSAYHLSVTGNLQTTQTWQSSQFPSVLKQSPAADIVRSIVIAQDKAELLTTLTARLQQSEALRKEVQTILFDWTDAHGPNLPLERMCEYGKKAKRLAPKLAVVRFVSLVARDLPLNSCNPLLNHGYDGILADVLALRAEELGLHPGTVAAWGQPQCIMQDDVMHLGLLILEFLAPYPLFSEGFVQTGGPEVLAQFLLNTERPKRVLVVLYELFQGNSVRLPAQDKHVALLDAAIHSGDAYSRQASAGLLNGFLADTNDFCTANATALVAGNVADLFLSALALARTQASRTLPPEADQLAQLVTSPAKAKANVYSMDFALPLEGQYFTEGATAAAARAPLDELAWSPHLLAALKRLSVLREGNLPQLNAVAAAVVCLLEVVDGPVGERNNLKLNVLSLLQAMTDRPASCEALVSCGLTQALLKTLPQATEQMRLSALKSLRNVIRQCANVRFDVMLHPSFLLLLPQLCVWTPPVVVSALWVLDGMLPRRDDGADVPYLVKSVVTGTIVPTLCRTLIQTLQRLYSESMDVTALQDTIVKALVPLLCRIAEAGYGEVVAQSLAGYHTLANALLQAAQEEDEEEYRTLAVQEAWVLFMDSRQQGALVDTQALLTSGPAAGMYTQFSSTGIYAGPDPNLTLQPPRTMRAARQPADASALASTGPLLPLLPGPASPPRPGPSVPLTSHALARHHASLSLAPSLNPFFWLRSDHTSQPPLATPGAATPEPKPPTVRPSLAALSATDGGEGDRGRWSVADPGLREFQLRQREKLLEDEKQCRGVCAESETIAFDIILMRAQADREDLPPARSLPSLPTDPNPSEPRTTEELEVCDVTLQELDHNLPIPAFPSAPAPLQLPLAHPLLEWEEERREVLETAQEEERRALAGIRGAARSILMERLGCHRRPRSGYRSATAAARAAADRPPPAGPRAALLAEFSAVGGAYYAAVAAGLAAMGRGPGGRPASECLRTPGAPLTEAELPGVLQAVQALAAAVQQAGLTPLVPRLLLLASVLAAALDRQTEAVAAAQQALDTLRTTPAVRSSQLVRRLQMANGSEETEDREEAEAAEAEAAAATAGLTSRPTDAALVGALQALRYVQAVEEEDPEDVLQRLAAEVIAAHYVLAVQQPTPGAFALSHAAAEEYLGAGHPLATLLGVAAAEGVPRQPLPAAAGDVPDLPGTPIRATAAAPAPPKRPTPAKSFAVSAAVRGPRVTPAKYQAMLSANVRR
eukprot:EG_transcript_694